MTDTTDTTDTAALREFLMEQIDHADSYGGKVWLCAEDARLAMSSLDQLEAERQRADDLVLHVNTQANMREKAEEKYTEVSGWYVKMKTRMLKAEEELAQLVNGQRLAITDDMAMAFHAATTDSALGRDDMEEIKAGLQAVQELFTAQQKPVVLPREIEPWEVIDILDPSSNPEDYACCVGADMYNAAIKACRKSVQAAGGVVKDGE